MTEIAINVIVTAVEHLNKTQPDCQIPLISDEFQQLAKSQGIWDGWHRIHSVQIGYLKHVEQQAQKIQQGFEKIKAIINSESPLPTSQEQVEHGQAVSSVKTVFENLLKDIRSLKYEPAPDPRQSTHKALQKPNPLSGPVSATSNLSERLKLFFQTSIFLKILRKKYRQHHFVRNLQTQLLQNLLESLTNWLLQI